MNATVTGVLSTKELKHSKHCVRSAVNRWDIRRPGYLLITAGTDLDPTDTGNSHGKLVLGFLLLLFCSSPSCRRPSGRSAGPPSQPMLVVPDAAEGVTYINPTCEVRSLGYNPIMTLTWVLKKPDGREEIKATFPADNNKVTWVFCFLLVGQRYSPSAELFQPTVRPRQFILTFDLLTLLYCWIISLSMTTMLM